MPFLYQEASKITSFGDIPLFVLSATDSTRYDDAISAEKIKDELIDAWAKMQKDQLNLSTNSEHILVQNSSHYIHEDQPQVIIEAVKRMILKTKLSDTE